MSHRIPPLEQLERLVADGDRGAAHRLWQAARRRNDLDLAIEATLVIGEVDRVVALAMACVDASDDGRLGRLMASVGVVMTRDDVDDIAWRIHEANGNRRVRLLSLRDVLRAIVVARCRPSGVAVHADASGNLRAVGSVCLAMHDGERFAVGIASASGRTARVHRAWPELVDAREIASRDAALADAAPPTNSLRWLRTPRVEGRRLLALCDPDPRWVAGRRDQREGARDPVAPFTRRPLRWASAMQALRATLADAESGDVVGRVERALADVDPRTRTCPEHLLDETASLFAQPGAPWNRLYRTIELHGGRGHVPDAGRVRAAAERGELDHVCSLELRGPFPSPQLPALAALLDVASALPSLVSLETVHMNLPAATWRHLADTLAPRLDRLVLSSSTAAGDPGAVADVVAAATAARTLELEKMPLGSLADAVAGLTQLEHLRLSGGGAEPLLRALRAPLRELTLVRAAIDEATAEALRGNDALDGLRCLHVRCLGDRPDGMERLFDGWSAPQLTSLTASVNAPLARARVVGALARSELPALKRFALPMHVEVGGEALATWQSLRGVHHFELAHVGLGCHTLTAMARAGLLDAARTLALQGNGLTASFARALTQRELAGLVELDLSHNALGTAGFRALAGWPALAGVERLVLCGARPGPRAIEALQGSRYLRAEVVGIDALRGQGWRAIV